MESVAGAVNASGAPWPARLASLAAATAQDLSAKASLIDREELLAQSLPWLALLATDALLVGLLLCSAFSGAARRATLAHFDKLELGRAVVALLALARPALDLGCRHAASAYLFSEFAVRQLTTPVFLSLAMDLYPLLFLLAGSSRRLHTLAFLAGVSVVVVVPLAFASYPVPDQILTEFDRFGVHEKQLERAAAGGWLDFERRAFWVDHYLTGPLTKLVFFSPLFSIFWRVYSRIQASRFRIHRARAAIQERRRRQRRRAAADSDSDADAAATAAPSETRQAAKKRRGKSAAGRDYARMALIVTGLAVLLQFLVLQMVHMGNLATGEAPLPLWPELGAIDVGSVTAPVRFHALTSGPAVFVHALVAMLVFGRLAAYSEDAAA